MPNPLKVMPKSVGSLKAGELANKSLNHGCDKPIKRAVYRLSFIYFLYQLDGASLGTYRPIKVISAARALDILNAMSLENLRRHACASRMVDPGTAIEGSSGGVTT